jgi:hypothetical protein
MKRTVSLIILVLYLLQPLACFACPCDSSLGGSDMVDTTNQSGSHSHTHDSDNCDSTLCCADAVIPFSEITLTYAPIVSVYVVPERYQRLPNVVIPIFLPPQNLS